MIIQLVRQTQTGKQSRAQVALETTLALIVLFIMLLGICQTWIYFNRILIERQQAYELTRTSSNITMNVYNAPGLNIDQIF